jgi:hypothetical protein
VWDKKVVINWRGKIPEDTAQNNDGENGYVCANGEGNA